jgi:L-amino acid N-acyltransferase YncA
MYASSLSLAIPTPSICITLGYKTKMLDYNFHISTARLTISYLDPNNDRHCDFVYELNSRPEMLIAHVTRPLNAHGKEAGRRFIEESVVRLEKNGFGRYLISRKPVNKPAEGRNDDHAPFSESINEHDLIGVVAMQCERFPGAPTVPDLGFALMAKYYGQGYATEAAQGLMKYYREERGQTKFCGFCDPTNERSIKMFARLSFEERGMKEIFGIIGKDVGMKMLVFTTGVEGDLEGMRDVEN